MKKFTIVLLICASIFMFAACGNDTPVTPDTNTPEVNAPELTVNAGAKEIIMPAEVNAKYFTESTRHGVVFKDGSNGEKSVLRGLTDEKEFHDALISIGAVASNNVTMDDMKAASSSVGAVPTGTKIDIFVKWDGSNGEVPFADIIKASEERPANYRFGGNLENAKSNNTGCVVCLDSCAVGIISDASYPTGTSQHDEIQFYGDSAVLPADGTLVEVIFRLAE